MVIKTQTCYTVSCDDCGSQFEHEWEPHWPTAKEAREEAEENEWWITDEADLCFGCRYKPHAFIQDLHSIGDCLRCANPAEEHPGECEWRAPR